jgi:hypothetical protein
MNEENNLRIVGCPPIVPESRNGNLGFWEMRFHLNGEFWRVGE